jgi:hypothetical protein
MKRAAVVAALVAAVFSPPGWAAGKSNGSCYSPAAIEAAEAIRFVTDLMIVSSVCQDTVYAEFRLRNQEAIRNYQKTLVAHYRGNAGFDRWNTALANQAAQKQSGNQLICQQSAALLQQAKALDQRGFRAWAAAQVASAGDRYQRCQK